MCQTFTYRVTDVHCDHCKQTIEEKISAVPGIEGVEVDVGSATVSVRAEADVTDASVREALAAAGYPAE